MKQDACNTLKTRAAFHYLKEHNRLDIYENYLRNKHEGTDGSELWRQIPVDVTDRVIKETIGEDTMEPLIARLETLAAGAPIDIIIGGPPCQAYSFAGRAKMGVDVRRDPRNYLYRYYLKFIDHFSPKMFVFENVMGITTAQTADMVKPFDDLKRIAYEMGYDVESHEQVASDYEVLQHRHRMIIVGWKREDEKHNPTGYHYPELVKVTNKFKTRTDIFADLPERKNGDGRLCEIVHYTKPLEEMKYLEKTGIRGVFNFTTQHVTRKNNERDREIYCIAIKAWKHKKRLNYVTLPERLKTHKNTDSFLNRFSVVDPHGCCHTVVAHIAKDGHYYIFPSENPSIENVRSISVREAARLQSFPDNYIFFGTKDSVYQQIGNAVPPVLGRAVAEKVLEILGCREEYKKLRDIYEEMK